MTATVPRRPITIVGGGQAGLILAIGLRRAGYPLRLVQDRSAAAIAGGRVMSSQCLFATALSIERMLGLDLWPGQAPRIEGICMQTQPSVDTPGNPLFFTGRLAAPAESIDQRLKFPAWLTLLERLGGVVEIATADIALLERCARDSDLVIVAAGKGSLCKLFPLNARWSPITQPMRALSMMYLRGTETLQRPHYVTSAAIADAGGVMWFPALTHAGHCEILFIEAVTGGPLDIARSDMSTHELWTAMQAALARVLPAKKAQLEGMRPVDDNAGLVGRITPTVRHAVGTLPSGRRILGIGDTVVLNDPLTGQGANNATKMAALYLQAILRRGTQPFDANWLDLLATAAWQRVRAATIWTNASLRPPTLPIVEFLRRASTDQTAADRFVAGFDEPQTIVPLLLGSEAT